MIFKPDRSVFVAHIGKFTDFPLFDEIHHLVHNRFDGGRRRNLRDLDAVLAFVVVVFAADFNRTASRFVNGIERLLVVQQIAAARKIRPQQRVLQTGIIDIRIAMVVSQSSLRLNGQMFDAIDTAIPTLELTRMDGKVVGSRVGSFKVLS